MKYIFLILLSFNALAQDDMTGAEIDMNGLQRDRQEMLKVNSIKEDLKQAKEPTGLEIDRAGLAQKPTAEWNYTYIRFSQSKLTFFEKEQGSSFAIGHRQVADSFYYDVQYNTMKTTKTKTNIQSGLLGFGWQASWAHRLKPYIGVQMGYSWMKSKKLDLSETGFYSGIDAGVILKRQFPFLFIIGTRYGINNFSKEEVKNISAQEFYLSLGLEFY